MKFKITCWLILFTCILSAQNSGAVFGKIDTPDGPASFANVLFEDSSQGTLTREDGTFYLEAKSGNYTLLIKHLGYKVIQRDIQITAGQKLEVNLLLSEDALGLDQVVVSATRGELFRKEAPVIVTVTNDRILQATQAISLSEGLNFQPGLRMETNCQNCGFSQVRINGLDGAYSQILINSRPVFSALNGVYGLDQIPANIIDRIEVVRGGGSALYGSNAIAGTINIITKEPIENSFTVNTNLGILNDRSFDRSVAFNGAVISNDFNSGITLYGLYRNRDPYDDNGDGFSEITKMENLTFGFNSYYKPGERSKLSLDFFTTDEFRRGGNNFDLQPFEADITEQIESDLISGGITYETYSEDLSNKFSAYVSAQLSKNDNFYGGSGETLEESLNGFGNSEDDTWVAGMQFSHKQKHFLGKEGLFTGGVEFRYNKAIDAKPGFNAFIDQTVRVYGIYAQQEWQATEKLKILGGLRADIHNLTRSSVNLNPRINVLYAPSESWQFRTSYARGFRAPQYFTEDLHATLAAGEVSFVRFLPGLKSETSHSFLASAEYTSDSKTSDLRLTAEAFFTRLNDPFITEQATEEEINELGIAAQEGQFIYLKKNSTGASVYGVNLEGQFAPNEKWIVQSGLTLQRSEYDTPVQWSEDENANTNDADQFFKSPNLYGNLVVTYAPVKKWQNNISAVYTGSMWVPHIAGFIPEDRLVNTNDFLEINLKTSYTFDLKDHYGIQLSAGIQNILNSYQDDFDLGPLRDANYVYGPSRPLTFFVGLKFGTDL
ncbi:TonB-dependent receptor [Flavobacteriaceae bacterium M23B6Z8]